jgi:hypothetical protein
MATTTISALPAATLPLTGTEVIPLDQGSTTSKVTVSSLFNSPAYGVTVTANTGGTTTLTNTSTYYQVFTGTFNQIVKLPDETTLKVGAGFSFQNNSTQGVVIEDSGGTVIYTIPSAGSITVYTTNNATATGNWNVTVSIPYQTSAGAVHFGTNGLDMGGGAILAASIGTVSPNLGYFTRIAYNNEAPGYTAITSAGGTTVLTVNSNYYQNIIGSNTQTIQLPDETTIPVGFGFCISTISNTAGLVTVIDAASSTLASMQPGTVLFFTSTSNIISSGGWISYAAVPTNMSNGPIAWGSARLNMNGNIIDNAVINPSFPNTGNFSLLSYTNQLPNVNSIPSTGGTTVLTASSSYIQRVTGTTTQTLQLPNETSVGVGFGFIIDNDSTGNVFITNSDATALLTVTPGMAGYIYSDQSGSAKGNWTGYLYAPAFGANGNITWGTSGLNLGNNLIDNAQIGSVTPNTGSFTTLTTTGVVNHNTTTNNQSYTTTGTGTITISSGTTGNINNMAIGATTPASGAFTTLSYNNAAEAITSTATAAGTTTLTNTSTYYQRFTGTTTQTVVLPSETTIAAGIGYFILNSSTGNVTVQDSSAATLLILPAGGGAAFTSLSNASATGNWSVSVPISTTTGSNYVQWGTNGLTAVGTTLAINNFNIGGTTAGTGKFTTLTYSSLAAGNIGDASTGKSTAATNIAATTTPTTGGVTMASQTAATTGTWKVTAYGNFVAASSATTRNAVITPYWGTTALPAISVAVLVSTAKTTNWSCEFELVSTSTTAVWTSGILTESIVAAGLNIDQNTPASTTVTSGSQTLDLRFSMSTVVAGDAWNITQVVFQRIK